MQIDLSVEHYHFGSVAAGSDGRLLPGASASDRTLQGAADPEPNARFVCRGFSILKHELACEPVFVHHRFLFKDATVVFSALKYQNKIQFQMFHVCEPAVKSKNNPKVDPFFRATVTSGR